MDIRQQIESQALVCPRTHEPLTLDPAGGQLVTADGGRRYRLHEGRVPVLLDDEAWAADYARTSPQMTREYAPAGTGAARRTALKAWVRGRVARDHRTDASVAAFQSITAGLPEGALGVSIGGGPFRVSPRFTTLNIGPFPNVDVIADAHLLPYAVGSVDAIECEAVLEHLADPARAVAEMYRVLKPGGQVFAATPFLQAYHGYPSHFQNFTVTGHQRLFQDRGFQITEAGPCVGPMNAWITLNAVFLRQYLPRPWGVLLAGGWQALSAPLRGLDRRLSAAPNGHAFASTTYLIARKCGVD